MHIPSIARRPAVALTLTIAFAVTAGCGGSDESEDGSASTTFTIGSTVPIATADPQKTTNVYDYPWLFYVYDRLTYLDAEGEPQPMLAESWESTDGGKTLTMVLRDDVTFQDGTPFDAEAVVANIDRMKNDEGSALVAQLAMVDKATAVDEHTVEVSMNTPAAAALPAIFGGYPGTMLSPAAFDDPDLGTTGAGAGAGPYEIERNTGDNSITLTKYDDYWDPSVQHFDEIVLQSMPDDETRINALISGSVDAALVRAPQVERVEGEGIAVVSELAAVPTTLDLNMSRSEFDDVKVRQAIMYALDRDAISEGAWGGTCQPGNQIFNENYWAYSEEVGMPYTYDPEKAKELLAEAGLPDGFTFEFAINPNPAYQTNAEIVQSQLAEVGIESKLTVIDGAEVTQRFWRDHDLDASILIDAFALDPAVVIANITGPSGFRNVSGYDNPEINRLATEAASLEDREERKELYAQISQIMLDEAVAPLVMCYQEQSWGFRDGFSGFAIGPTGLWDFRNVTSD